MALYDNQHWLLSHIRDSFLSTDDTGILFCCCIVNISISFSTNLRHATLYSRAIT